MWPIRRVLSLIFALALTGAGLYMLSLLFTTEGFFVRIALAGSMMLAIGLYWLWADFINADPRPDQ